MSNFADIANAMLEREEMRKPAARAYRVVFSIIKEFESKTPETHLVCAKFVVYSQPVVIRKVTYINPNLLVFSGRLPNDSSVHIVQDVSQLNLALLALPKPENAKIERRKIGFEIQDQESESN